MHHDSRQPVGVFDSGIGGLTILRELLATLPDEHFVYFGDDANCPYGPRPAYEVRALALAAARWLVDREAKAIVVACNSASVTARDVLRATFPDTPIVVVVPAVKPAAAMTTSGKIILAATDRSINDHFTHGLIDQFATGTTVFSVACPGLVELVERGELDGPAAEAVITRYFRPALAEGADVVVLGCTHFPALRASVQRVVGPTVQVIDSGAAVARQTRRVLTDRALLAPVGSPTAGAEYWTSGDPDHFAAIATIVLGRPVSARHVAPPIDWEAGR